MKTALAASVLTMASTSANAGSIDLSDLTLYGDAFIWDDKLVLTPNEQSQSGFAFDSNQYSNITNFTASFDLYLGTKNYYGADGITFAWVENPVNQLVNGGGLGYSSALGGYAVEFDTYYNQGDDSTIYDHVAIDQGSYANSLTTTAVSNLENGRWHSADITFNSGVISVILDGNTVINDYTIEGYTAFDGYFGFTGATGYYSNLQKVKNFTLTSSSVTSAVPEASTIGMMLGGLGLVGFMAARRLKQA